ncbi:cysteine-rich KTR domain-containing protein [Lacrimispora indolis]|uniref:cysteine-rich KTR domain-containing protein n=1 Tax=Lacrimispora indolis TaxID=69825 RepID=UPI00345FE757
MQRCGLSCHSREVKPVEKEKWLLCSVCKNKTRIRIRNDTELKAFSKITEAF